MSNMQKMMRCSKFLAILFLSIASFSAISQSTEINCGVGSRISQGKPGHTCFGTERIGSCSASAKWWCHPSWIQLSVSGASEEGCRVVDFTIGSGSSGRTWIHLMDTVTEVEVSGQPVSKDEPIRITDCAIFKYVKNSSEGYRDASEIPDSRPAPSKSPQASGRQATEAESLFGAALSKSPEELRAEIAEHQKRANEWTFSDSSAYEVDGLEMLSSILLGIAQAQAQRQQARAARHYRYNTPSQTTTQSYSSNRSGSSQYGPNQSGASGSGQYCYKEEGINGRWVCR